MVTRLAKPTEVRRRHSYCAPTCVGHIGGTRCGSGMDAYWPDTDAMYQGCGTNYPFDPHVLEVDHINPWSQGGTDASESLTLLCPPGNRENRDLYTLFGLHAVNLMAGNMKNEANLRVARASGQRTGRRRRL